MFTSFKGFISGNLKIAVYYDYTGKKVKSMYTYLANDLKYKAAI